MNSWVLGLEKHIDPPLMDQCIQIERKRKKTYKHTNLHTNDFKLCLSKCDVRRIDIIFKIKKMVHHQKQIRPLNGL